MTGEVSHLVGPLLRYARERELVVQLDQFGLAEEAFLRDESPIADRLLGRLFDEIASGLGEPPDLQALDRPRSRRLPRRNRAQWPIVGAGHPRRAHQAARKPPSTANGAPVT